MEGILLKFDGCFSIPACKRWTPSSSNTCNKYSTFLFHDHNISVDISSSPLTQPTLPAYAVRTYVIVEAGVRAWARLTKTMRKWHPAGPRSGQVRRGLHVQIREANQVCIPIEQYKYTGYQLHTWSTLASFQNICSPQELGWAGSGLCGPLDLDRAARIQPVSWAERKPGFASPTSPWPVEGFQAAQRG